MGTYSGGIAMPLVDGPWHQTGAIISDSKAQISITYKVREEKYSIVDLETVHWNGYAYERGLHAVGTGDEVTLSVGSGASNVAVRIVNSGFLQPYQLYSHAGWQPIGTSSKWFEENIYNNIKEGDNALLVFDLNYQEHDLQANESDVHVLAIASRRPIHSSEKWA